MKKVITSVLIAVLVVAVGALGFLYVRERKAASDARSQANEAQAKLEEFKTDPDAAAREEVNRYVAEVGELYALPANEEPSVATVNDKSKLTDQPFFANAENGDVTLIYAQSKLAILYRPSSKQLVNVSSVTIQEDSSTPAN